MTGTRRQGERGAAPRQRLPTAAPIHKESDRKRPGEPLAGILQWEP
jgi:hypothetical protein